MIDLRSDTVTLPTKNMMTAIGGSTLGDDVLGEDPTVARLERLAADRLGKEAALFMPSGTMANLCAMLSHCPRGSRVLVGDESHVFHYEAGGASALGSLVLHTIANTEDGGLDAGALARALVSPDDPHVAPVGLLALENTHNRCGGVVLGAELTRSCVEAAHAHGVPVHLDGARIFNAAVALGVDVRTLVSDVDSVQFCLSKGLSAPAGSMLVGTSELVRRARRARKMLGGGMRQVGVLAAAGIVALDEMIDRLGEDHALARRFADGLRAACGDAIDVSSPQTNIVFVRARSSGRSIEELASELKDRDVLVSVMGGDRLRAVTHRGVASEEIGRAVQAFERAAAAWAR